MMYPYIQKIIVSLFVFFSLASWAQNRDEFEFPRSEDIGLNITNVLSSFVGNSNADFDLADFPFQVKVNRKNRAIRFGLGVKVKNTDETLFGVEQIVFNNFGVHSRLGIEWKKYLGHKVGFFAGVDLVSIYSNEEDIVSNNIDISVINTNTIGGGGGPVFGFEYYLNKNMYFSTEGNLYGIFKYSERKESFRNNPNINIDKVSYDFEATLTSPIQLYIMVRF